MADDTYEFCKIYARSSDMLKIIKVLELRLGEEFHNGIMHLNGLTVEVLKNPDAGIGGDFVLWPTFVEFEADETVPNNSVVAIVSEAIEAMWESGIPAVASCFFEDELPWRGGIGRLD